MYLCIDAHYTGCRAVTAGIVIPDHRMPAIKKEYLHTSLIFERYIPGQFSKRELPGILSLFSMVEEKITHIIIDGYAWLSSGWNRPGLGARLFTELGEDIPVIGVAKSPWQDDSVGIRVFRGDSVRPLYISAAGIEDKDAGLLVQQMHGRYRIPTMLRYVDRMARRYSPQEHFPLSLPCRSSRER